MDENAAAYQTADTSKGASHIGKIRSRCEVSNSCSPQEKAEIKAIMGDSKKPYKQRVKELHELESGKSYPERYPTNDDSIGIEVVGKFNAETGKFDPVSAEQLDVISKLVEKIKGDNSLTDKDVFRHGDISYKQPTEGYGLGYDK